MHAASKLVRTGFIALSFAALPGLPAFAGDQDFTLVNRIGVDILALHLAQHLQ